MSKFGPRWALSISPTGLFFLGVFVLLRFNKATEQLRWLVIYRSPRLGLNCFPFSDFAARL
jgi:hypothetical protein